MFYEGLALYAIAVLYIGVGVWVIHRRWPLRGGLMLLAISLLPLLLIPGSPDSEAPGSAAPAALMSIPALLLIAVGLFAFAVRLSLRGLRRRRGEGLRKT
jgi:hypothetical protein